MVRAANLFAAASIALLIVGLVLSNFIEKTQAMSVRWPGSNTGYVIDFQVPCYGLAGLFAIFACSYALGQYPISQGRNGLQVAKDIVSPCTIHEYISANLGRDAHLRAVGRLRE